MYENVFFSLLLLSLYGVACTEGYADIYICFLMHTCEHSCGRLRCSLDQCSSALVHIFWLLFFSLSIFFFFLFFFFSSFSFLFLIILFNVHFYEQLTINIVETYWTWRMGGWGGGAVEVSTKCPVSTKMGTDMGSFLLVCTFLSDQQWPVDILVLQKKLTADWPMETQMWLDVFWGNTGERSQLNNSNRSFG